MYKNENGRNLRHYARVFSISRLHLSSKKLADNTKGHLKFFQNHKLKREERKQFCFSGFKAWIVCKGQNHLFAPVLIINAKKMHCYHMALSQFKILTIFGNLQRAVNPLKWLKKADSARLLYIYIFLQSNSIFFSYQKCVCDLLYDKTTCRTTQVFNADFLCPKVDLLQLQISYRTEQ